MAKVNIFNGTISGKLGQMVLLRLEDLHMELLQELGKLHNGM